MGLGDIEEVGVEEVRLEHGEPRSPVVLKRRGRQKEEGERPQTQGFVPGTGTVYMRTWGCSHNSSDSEYMAGLLAAAGYRIQHEKEGADLWVLNSCTVKTPSETAILNQLNEAEKKRVPVVVAGCVPQAAPSTQWLSGQSLLGVQQIDRIVEVVESTMQGNSVRLLASKRAGGKRGAGADLSLPKIRKNPLIEILSVNTGCLNHCTYCKTKQARGDLASYTIDQLVDRALQSFAEGVKELWLTSEDLGAYGRDIGHTLPDLLYRLVEVIPEGCRMRLGMTNPPYILDHLKEVAEIMNHPRVYSFLHIPVQAGSDPVLLDMRREYTVAEFRKVVDFITREVPGAYIATDVICGFPSETAADFEETLALVRDYHFPSLFINQYYPRPNTPAARMKRIDTVEVKRRTKEISELFASYCPYEGSMGREVEVLVTERATDRTSLVGHTKSYEQVLLPGHPCFMGEVVRCRVVGFGKFYMRGRPFYVDWGRLWWAYQLRTRRRGLVLLGSLALFALAAFRTYRHLR